MDWARIECLAADLSSHPDPSTPTVALIQWARIGHGRSTEICKGSESLVSKVSSWRRASATADGARLGELHDPGDARWLITAVDVRVVPIARQACRPAGINRHGLEPIDIDGQRFCQHQEQLFTAGGVGLGHVAIAWLQGPLP